ncbi:hypothetical protein O6H91_07G030000 [Diphasiastrum complanatum]|uniref:Uncharacterized protein n=1 Tax=Diphasiastrum complanatum TaxID=34168 RepID=A0ACC2D3V9_DIPCM|nr:hypothetical protein O6H91_07G030000 [Diphasiastrum complanatum]
MSGKAVVHKVARSIDWEFIAKIIVSDEGKKELGTLRRAFEDVNNTLETKFNVKPPTINWDFYKEKLGPSIVNIFQKSYESLEIPEYEDTYTPEYKKKYEEWLVKATQMEEESKREAARLSEELKKLQQKKEALRTLTVDKYLADHPDLKQKIDEEIKNHNWGY